MSFDMALLHPYDVVYISFFWPGSIYSDAVAGFVKSVSESAIPARLARHLPYFEQPEFTALVLNVLHDDPKLMSYSGQTLIGAELGERLRHSGHRRKAATVLSGDHGRAAGVHHSDTRSADGNFLNIERPRPLCQMVAVLGMAKPPLH
jgi:hypothetical protein